MSSLLSDLEVTDDARCVPLLFLEAVDEDEDEGSTGAAMGIESVSIFGLENILAIAVSYYIKVFYI